MKPENHGRDHRPGGEDPIPGVRAVKVGYFGITETAYNGSGDQDFTMALADTSDASVFDVTGGLARVQAGVFEANGKLEFSSPETFTTGSADLFTFEVVFGSSPTFEFLNHYVVLPFTSGSPLHIVTCEFNWQFITDAAFTFRLHLTTPAGAARNIENCGIYVARVCDHDW